MALAKFIVLWVCGYVTVAHLHACSSVDSSQGHGLYDAGRQLWLHCGSIGTGSEAVGDTKTTARRSCEAG